MANNHRRYSQQQVDEMFSFEKEKANWAVKMMLTAEAERDEWKELALEYISKLPSNKINEMFPILLDKFIKERSKK